MSRAFTFWNDETIKLIQDEFVAASVPTSICRSDSPEGEFLRSAGIDKQWVTSTGYMTCVSASGRLLGTAPCAEAIEKFLAIPEAERGPGAVQVPTLEESERAIASPPAGGLVLRVHARFLAREDSGKLRHVTTDDFPLMREDPEVARSRATFLEPNTDYMWLTSDEWRSLVPDEPTSGATFEVAPAIVERMARFHLSPQRALTSESLVVDKRTLKSAHATLLVDEVSPQRILMRLSGFVHWGSDYDASKATTPNGPLAQGYETPLYGRLEYDRRNMKLTRFDIVAPGDVWGRWGDANGKSVSVERPNRNPVGFAFELTTGDTPTDRIPPGGNAEYIMRKDYFGTKD